MPAATAAERLNLFDGATIFKQLGFGFILSPILVPGLTGWSQPAARAKVEQGKRLARTLGCSACHGGDFSGSQGPHDDQVVVLYSANLTKAVPASSDAQTRSCERC